MICGESDVSPAIRLEYSHDEELEVGGYEYFERDGDLVISGAVREGSSNGVYRFLEKECGWTNLFFGTSGLRETDSLVIEKGLYGREVPAFEWHTISANYSKIPYKNDRSPMSKAQQSYPQRHASHGMTYNIWADWQPNNHTGQLCYTAEIYLETTIDNIREHLKKQETDGAVIGETIRYIDISQGDSGRYCQCKNCTDIASEEKAIVGPVVRWANTVADTINADYKGRELYFLIFAYYNMYDDADNGKCWHCWAYGERMYGTEIYDLAYIEKNYEKMAELFESAILLAGSEKQQARCEMLSISLYYTGCYTSFFKAYDEVGYGEACKA